VKIKLAAVSLAAAHPGLPVALQARLYPLTLTAPNRGTGACLFSNGAKYQMHFGS
jgi:hypothetical protein